MTARINFVVISIAVTIFILILSTIWRSALLAFIVVLPLIAVGIRDMTQRTKTLRRLYPLVCHFRYFLESFRPEIQQYFIESRERERENECSQDLRRDLLKSRKSDREHELYPLFLR